jgi:hypothetical protein
LLELQELFLDLEIKVLLLALAYVILWVGHNMMGERMDKDCKIADLTDKILKMISNEKVDMNTAISTATSVVLTLLSYMEDDGDYDMKDITSSITYAINGKRGEDFGQKTLN